MAIVFSYRDWRISSIILFYIENRFTFIGGEPRI